MKRELLAKVYARSGLGALSKAIWPGVVVFNYHRIGDSTGALTDHDLWSASSDAFASQVRKLRQCCDIVSPADLPEVVQRGRGRFALITFDDGYLDNYESAYPILKSERVPATFFVATGFIDRTNVPWWDEIAWMIRCSSRKTISIEPWHIGPIDCTGSNTEAAIQQVLRIYKSVSATEAERVLEVLAESTGSGRCAVATLQSEWMTWDMIRTMQESGMEIGGHTVSHPILSRLSTAMQRAEITGCAERIRSELGKNMRLFSYPVGGQTTFDEGTMESLRQCGVEMAFSQYGGCRSFAEWSNYDIRRVPVETHVSLDLYTAIAMLPRVFAPICGRRRVAH